MMNSGRLLSGNPCLGSWVTYGLGSENENLPGFVVMLDKTGGPISGAKNWSSGYMPAAYQATVLRLPACRSTTLPRRPGPSRRRGRLLLDRLRQKNEAHLVSRRIIPSWPRGSPAMSWRSRCNSPRPRLSISPRNPPRPQSLYGIDQPRTADFGRKCLIARRLVERGVRFIQIYSGGSHNDNNWDAHADLVDNHTKHAGNTDKPIAGLIKDLKRRGLLDQTLMVWGGEFGRQPTAEFAKGPVATITPSASRCGWPAAGSRAEPASARPTSWATTPSRTGSTSRTSTPRSCISSGLDPNRLSYFYGGLHQKLVGVEGAEPIRQII